MLAACHLVGSGGRINKGLEDHPTASRGALESEQGYSRVPALNFNSSQNFHTLKRSTALTEDPKKEYVFKNSLLQS
jgi:hypothetical protein